MSDGTRSPARELADGTAAYTRGDFAAAARSFESAIAAGADSADAWYNLGNALARGGETGRAVLAWERSLRRDPGGEDARANLEAVLAASPDAALVGEEPVLARLGSRLPPDPLAAGLIAAWAAASVALVGRRLVAGRGARLVLALCAAVLVAASAILAGATWLSWRAHSGPTAVVVSAVAQVRDVPEDGATAVFELHSGTRVRVLGHTGPFARIRLPSGLSGFLEARAIEPVSTSPDRRW